MTSREWRESTKKERKGQYKQGMEGEYKKEGRGQYKQGMEGEYKNGRKRAVQVGNRGGST